MRWLLLGDAESVHLQRLADQLVACDIDLHVCSFGPPGRCPGQYHELPMRGALRDLRFPAAIPEVRRLQRALRADVVHGHYLTSYGMLAASSGGSFIVQTAWGSDLLTTATRPGYRQLIRWSLRRATLVTADSQQLLTIAAELAPTPERLLFVFGPPESAWGEPLRRFPSIVSIRNHEPLYRIDRILAAWPLVREALPGHRLVVVGAGSLTDELRRLASDGVEITGQLPHGQVIALLGEAQVVVSIPEHDGTSASVLESLARGCPVVGSDIPANREWIEDRFLLDPDRGPRALADAIISAVGSAATLDRRWALEAQVGMLVEEVRSRLV